jgi:hypothetical protein
MDDLSVSGIGCGPERDDRQARWATVSLGLVEVVALGYWLFVARHAWFYNDDWEFLVTRKAGDLGDLFRPHSEHWVAVPMLAYRALFAIFGLHTYVPYLLMVIGAHLIVVALVFAIMRRAGVRPWIAAAAAASLAFYGRGVAAIIVPVLVCFTGALAFGLTHLLLADHDGRIRLRDWLGVIAGLLGLMCSGVAVSMVVVVAIAVVSRRGWRIGLFHTVPLVAWYALWYLVRGHRAFFHSYSVQGVGSIVSIGYRAVGYSIGRFAPLVIAIAVAFVGGLVLAWRERRRSRRLVELVSPLALAAGSLVFMSSVATSRAFLGAGNANSGRYVYVVMVTILPALAVAADALANRWRWLLPGALILFVGCIPANMQMGSHTASAIVQPEVTMRDVVLSLPDSPYARTAPRSLRPLSDHGAFRLTMGWLLDAKQHGRLPRPPAVSALTRRENSFRLAFSQERAPGPTTSCRNLTPHSPYLNALLMEIDAVTSSVVLNLKKGDVLGVSHAVVQVSPTFLTPSDTHPPLLFFPSDGNRIVVLHSVGPVLLQAVTTPWTWRIAAIQPRLLRTPSTVCVQRKAAPTPG